MEKKVIIGIVVAIIIIVGAFLMFSGDKSSSSDSLSEEENVQITDQATTEIEQAFIDESEEIDLGDMIDA